MSRPVRLVIRVFVGEDGREMTVRWSSGWECAGFAAGCAIAAGGLWWWLAC